jgi:hypothetical protein
VRGQRKKRRWLGRGEAGKESLRVAARWANMYSLQLFQFAPSFALYRSCQALHSAGTSPADPPVHVPAGVGTGVGAGVGHVGGPPLHLSESCDVQCARMWRGVARGMHLLNKREHTDGWMA